VTYQTSNRQVSNRFSLWKLIGALTLAVSALVLPGCETQQGPEPAEGPVEGPVEEGVAGPEEEAEPEIEEGGEGQ